MVVIEEKFLTWSKQHYHFNPNQNHLSVTGSRSFGDKALTLELILSEMNDGTKKG